MSRPSGEVWSVHSNRGGMSIVFRAELVDLAAKVNMTAIVVWVCLDTYADRDGEHAWPMQRTVARDLSIDLRTVRRAVAQLRAAGMLTSRTVEHRGTRKTVYSLHHTVPIPDKR